jgi:IS4 transposase
LKRNADYRVVERRDVSHLKNIFSGQIIEFTGFYTFRKCPYRLRRIRSKDPETGKIIVLLTDQFDWSAQTIAGIYKERWQIELFFKAFKQQLHRGRDGAGGDACAGIGLLITLSSSPAVSISFDGAATAVNVFSL